MERDSARNHDAIASIHDGNTVKSFKKRGLTMKENFLVDLSKQFAVDIVNPTAKGDSK